MLHISVTEEKTLEHLIIL